MPSWSKPDSSLWIQHLRDSENCHAYNNAYCYAHWPLSDLNVVITYWKIMKWKIIWTPYRHIDQKHAFSSTSFSTWQSWILMGIAWTGALVLTSSMLALVKISALGNLHCAHTVLAYNISNKSHLSYRSVTIQKYLDIIITHMHKTMSCRPPSYISGIWDVRRQCMHVSSFNLPTAPPLSNIVSHANFDTESNWPFARVRT